jgi:hypothetical protein
MRLDYEVVHLVDGHLFDAESYEVKSVEAISVPSKPGYYLLLRTRHGGRCRDNAAAQFVGPYTTAQYAILAIRELHLRGGTIDGGSAGSPEAASTRSRGDI